VLTETETDVRPTIRGCSCGGRDIPISFFHRIRLFRFFSTDLTGQSYIAYCRNTRTTCSLANDSFFFLPFFSILKVTFPCISDCFRNFKGSDIANGSHNSDIIVESRIEHAEASGRMNVLHGSRLSQVYVTRICC